MKRNKTVKTGILVALLLLVVGFAAVTTNLSLNGTATVGANESDFTNNVQFAKGADAPTVASSVTEHTGGNATVSEDGKTLTFTTPVMNTLDETVTVTYKVSNQSNYIATIGALSCKIYTSDAADAEEATDGYLTVTPANALNGKDVAKKDISGADTVAVKLAKTYAGEANATYTVKCTLPATGKSA